MNYQTTSDEEPTKSSPLRPPDQAMRGSLNMQIGGADEIGELGTKAIHPPYSNPSSGELQMAGADSVEEIRGGAKDNWAWETQAGGTKSTAASD